MSILVKIRVNSEKLNFIRKPIITSGDKNVVRCKFCFSDEWDGYTKTATFARNNEAPIHVPVTDDECIIPYTVLSCKCKLHIGVVGERDGKRITSNLLAYDILKGANDEPCILPNINQVNEAIENYCKEQDFATQTYVNEAIEKKHAEEVLDNIILNGGSAESSGDGGEQEGSPNFVFNGGEAETIFND